MDEKVKKLIYNVPNNQHVAFLKYRSYHKEIDLFRLSCIIFNIESCLRLGYVVEAIEIPISAETYSTIPVKEIEALLTELLTFVTLIRPQIKIVSQYGLAPKREGHHPALACEAACLFSGGIDSTTGVLNAAQFYKRPILAVFANHIDQGKIGSIVENIYDFIQNKESRIQFEKIYVPRMFSVGYSQLRGFLYTICGGIFAKLHKTNQLLITECGPTMYQIKYSPLDSVTMTTHPFVLSKAKKILELFFNNEFIITIPFENLTKAEVALANPYPELLAKSHSCIGSRWILSGSKGRPYNDGTCYGCVVRRLALYGTDLTDCSYNKDPFLSEGANEDNIQNILAFSLEFLLAFHEMDEYQTEIIHQFSKKGLFTRFSLDNLAALHLAASRKEPINSHLVHHYIEFTQLAGSKILEDRLFALRRKDQKPNFKKRVS